MEDYVKTLAMLKVMSESMEKMAAEAKLVYDEAIAIKERSEAIESLVNECLALIGA